MGKTTRWFRALLGAKKSSAPGATSDSRPAKNSYRSNGGSTASFTEASYVESVDANKHAIAVAAATAAVAEAALAAAQAAAEVVRLTSGASRANYISCGSDRLRESAAVVIQSAFRAYLARRALKALKALVKLQALVRGHIVRKQSTHMLQRMQAMARIQARACKHRAHMTESTHSSSKSSYSHQTPQTMQRCVSKSSIKDNIGLERKNVGSNLLDHWMEENSWNRRKEASPNNGHADDEKSDKILEVDTWKPHMNTSQHVPGVNLNEKVFKPFESLTRHSTKSGKAKPIPSPQEFLNFRSLECYQEVDQSPRVCPESSRPGSSSSRRGPSTPARSECSRSFFSNYMGQPNYMTNTESSRAKVRSQSAPRQRIDFERSGSTKRFDGGYLDEETSSERGWPLHGNFGTRPYPGGSGSLGKHGLPALGYAMGYGSSTYDGRR